MPEPHPPDLSDQTGRTPPTENPSIQTLTKLVTELPVIGAPTIRDDEFWSCRKLRPDAEGSSYHNIPVLGFVIRFDGELAILAIPSLEYVNEVVRLHNTGGFTFVQGGGFEETDAFLGKISQKQFPRSDDRAINYTGIPDTYREFRSYYYGWEGQSKYLDPDFTGQVVQNLYEHDLVDHTGIAALPEEEADKVASLAAHLLALPQSPHKKRAASSLDRALDILSDYALAPQSDEVDSWEPAYREFIWMRLQSSLRNIHEHVEAGGGR